MFDSCLVYKNAGKIPNQTRKSVKPMLDTCLI